MDIGLNFFTLELIGGLFFSMLLGAIVGFEREVSKKPAGLRTHVLVCMGAYLFTISSFYFSPSLGSGDFTRIAAGVVTGIGFIGAGSIIATKGHVKGLTTAASLWLVASLGLLVGMGSYVISFLGAILGFIVLRFGKIEKNLEKE